MKKLTKVLLSGILVSSMIFSNVNVFANTNEVKVTIGSNIANVNGQNVKMDAMPYIQEYTNVTMIPLRFVATALGIPDSDITYNAETKRIGINTNKKFNEVDEVVYFLNQNIGSYGYAELKNGRTYIPLRVLCNSLSLSVEWDNTIKTATMTSNVSLVNNSTNNTNQSIDNPVINNTQNNNSTNQNATNTQDVRAMEEEVVRLVNEERVKYDLQPLQINEDLMQSAREKSEDMATRNYYSHTDPDGYTMATHLNIAENIYASITTAEEAVNGWMNSEGHRANILNPDFKYIGVGYAKNSNSEYTHYWTQQFD